MKKEKIWALKSRKIFWSIITLQTFERSRHEKYFFYQRNKKIFTAHFTTFGCIYWNSCAHEYFCNVIVSILVHQIPITSQCASLLKFPYSRAD